MSPGALTDPHAAPRELAGTCLAQLRPRHNCNQHTLHTPALSAYLVSKVHSTCSHFRWIQRAHGDGQEPANDTNQDQEAQVQNPGGGHATGTHGKSCWCQRCSCDDVHSTAHNHARHALVAQPAGDPRRDHRENQIDHRAAQGKRAAHARHVGGKEWRYVRAVAVESGCKPELVKRKSGTKNSKRD